MADLAFYLAGIVAILAATYKLTKAQGQPTPSGLAYLTGELLCVGVAAILLAPTTLRLFAHIEPISNITRLVGNVLTAASLFCMLGVLAHATQPTETARRRMRSQQYVFAATHEHRAAPDLRTRVAGAGRAGPSVRTGVPR